MRQRTGPIALVVVLGVGLGFGTFLRYGDRFTGPAALGVATTTTTTSTTSSTTTSTTTTVTTTTTTLPTRARDEIPGWTVGQPWGTVEGVTMFRGNPTRTFYGTGPITGPPSVLWRYPDSQMCATTSIGGSQVVWCGTGWTGQPAIHEREDGVTELIFGAYDRAVHFVDVSTGTASRPRFVTGDIIKGSVTLDPDGYPLLYFGSRDNKLRIVALDRDQPTELWSLDANAVQGIWNNDWDGNPVIVDDIMYEGGENGWFFAYALNRSYGADGLVSVSPDRLLAMPGYTSELVSLSGRNLSIESSPVVYEQRVYFTNSGGRVVGLDVSDIRNGNAPIVFDFWAGGDIDATPVVDEDGYLYLAIEYEPSDLGGSGRTPANLARNREVGQLIKLDPYTSGDPLVWRIDLRSGSGNSGIWATPALYAGHLYVPTHNGDLLAVDTATGEIVWSDPVGWHAWSSPIVIEGILIQATCTGDLKGYSLADPARPVPLWTVDVTGSCLESSPIAWKGTIYIGSRDGYMRALR